MQIPAISLVPAPDTPEGEALIGFKWADPKIGARHRIGGSPDWIQEEAVPACSCSKPMSFYAQIDSLGDAICIGDCGMIYVFICWDCLETKSVLQSY